MGIDKQSEIAANLQIGPTSAGMVRIYVEAEGGIELPLDFDPDEAEEIAEELRAAAEAGGVPGIVRQRLERPALRARLQVEREDGVAAVRGRRGGVLARAEVEHAALRVDGFLQFRPLFTQIPRRH